MATKKEQKTIRHLSTQAEMAVTRFSDTYIRTPEVFWADRKTAHTDLADGWSWAIGAMADAIALLSNIKGEHDQQLAEAMTLRLQEYRRQEEAMYQFKTYDQMVEGEVSA